MNQHRQMFLQSLYFKLFELHAKEKKLMANHDFDDVNACIRNDQSIAGVREETKTMEDIISKYLILEA